MSTLRQIGGVLKLFFFTKKIVHTTVWCSFVCHLNITYNSVPVCFVRRKSSHMEKQSQVPSIWKQGMCEGISSQNFPGLFFVSFFLWRLFFQLHGKVSPGAARQNGLLGFISPSSACWIMTFQWLKGCQYKAHQW